MTLNAPAASLYCERASRELWAEPLNAGTSLFVIVVAIVGFFRLRRQGLLSPSVCVMMGLAVLIGVGSFLLHSFATVWAEVADVVPIWAFVAFYAAAVTRRFAPVSLRPALIVGLALGVVASGTGLAMGPVARAQVFASGTTQYLPAILATVAILGFLWKSHHPATPGLAVGVAFFGLSLGFRSVDMVLCDQITTGTHFFWHMSNCVVFWFLIRAYAVHAAGAPATRSAPQGVPPDAGQRLDHKT